MEIWKQKQPATVSGIESADNNILLITSHRGHVYLLDSETGDRIGKIWQAFISDISSHSLDLNNDLLFIASRKKNQVIAHNIAQGRTAWKKKIMDMQGKIVSYNDKIYILQQNGIVTALDKLKGKEVLTLQLNKAVEQGLFLWKNQLLLKTLDGELIFLSLDLKIIKSLDLKLCAEPALSMTDQFIIIVNCDGQITLLDQSGILSHPFEISTETVYAPPQILGQKLLLSLANGNIKSLNMNTGKRVWEFENGDGLLNLPVQTTETQVIIPYSRGTIISLDLETGLEQWRYKLKHPIRHFKLTQMGLIVMDSKKYLSLIR